MPGNSITFYIEHFVIEREVFEPSTIENIFRRFEALHVAETKDREEAVAVRRDFLAVQVHMNTLPERKPILRVILFFWDVTVGD